VTGQRAWDVELRSNAAAYARVALANIEREFPSDVCQVLRDADDPRPRPRERTRGLLGQLRLALLRRDALAPGAPPAHGAEAIRRPTSGRRSAASSARGAARRRAAFNLPSRQSQPRAPVRLGMGPRAGPRVEAWGDPDGRRWAAAATPLARAAADNFLGWLPRRPIRFRYGRPLQQRLRAGPGPPVRRGEGARRRPTPGRRHRDGGPPLVRRRRGLPRRLGAIGSSRRPSSRRS